jgi:hypothetical protein
MPIVEIPGLGNVEFPDTMTNDQIGQAIRTNIMPKVQATQPAVSPVGQPVSPTALTPPPPAQTQDAFSGAFGRSLYNIGADIDLLKGKITGDTEAAEKRAKELRQWGSQVYRDTEKGWTEAPGTKIAELFGGSLPYMAAPAAAAMLAPELTIGLGLTAADLTAGLVSAAQFTGSNLARQTDNEKKSLAEASLLNAGLASIPQAALDVTGLKFIPGIRRIFGEAGVKITDDVAENLVKKSILAKAGSVALQTGKTMGVEGATEAAQQLFERLQAGLSITDADARKEYYDNFIGGAVLGGALAGPGIGLEHMIDKAKPKTDQIMEQIQKQLSGEEVPTGEAPPTPPASTGETQPPAPPTTPPQPNVVTPEQLLTHATTRLQELETKVNGTETTPPQPLTPQEEAELKFLQEHQANPDKLAEGYGVSIGKPRVTGSQDVEGALGELEGKPIPVPPIYQPPVETTPPVETQPATPEEPATPEVPPTEEGKPPVEETPPTVIKEPPKIESTGKVIDNTGKEHSLPTVSEAQTAGFSFQPINPDKPMYAKTDLNGVMSMIYNLFGDKNYTSYTNMANSKYKVTPDKNQVLPKNKLSNQVSVEFRPDTLSGRQLNDNEFFADDTAHRAIESFTIHNPTSQLKVNTEEARLGANYLKKFFDIGNNVDGSITYTLKRVRSEDELNAENERLSKEFLEHINAPRGKLTYKYTKKRKPGLNTFQQSINQHEKVGDAFKDILSRIEKAIAENKYETLRKGFTNESIERYVGEDPIFYEEFETGDGNKAKLGLYKNQLEMYVDIIKHLMKIDPVMKTNLFMDPNIVGSRTTTIMGFYDRVQNTIALFANSDLPTFVHEAIHAATVHYIEMHPNDPKVKQLYKLLQESRKGDKKSRGKWEIYGHTNLKEFIAEAFSNPEFIQRLKGLDPVFDKSEATSIFDNIKTIVRGMMKAMGINTDKDRSVFDEVMDLSSELFIGKTLEGYKYDLRHPLDSQTANIIQTKSPAFKKWFGKSKIVNADGKPKVMYHGTVGDINKFNTKFIFVSDNPENASYFSAYAKDRALKEIARQIDQNPQQKLDLITKLVDDAIANKKLGIPENSNGMFTTTREEHIQSFMNRSIASSMDSLALKETLLPIVNNMMETGRNIMPVYVRAENPFDYDNPRHVKQLSAKLYDKTLSTRLKEESNWNAIESQEVQDAIKSLGFDSFYTKENGEKNLAVYNPNQIKSAIGNKGTYNLASDVITESMMPDYESVKPESGTRVQTKPGANTAILANILGQQMYAQNIGKVSVKEMLQNSYDAIKSMLDSGDIKRGKIDVNLDEANRTISVKDNGHGMTQDTLGNTFVTIAGSLKESEISSGSFGIAKLAFLFDAGNIHVATMRNGKISVLNTTGKQLKDALSDPSLAPYTESYTPEEYGLDKVKKDFPDGHGTITTIQIPETHVNKSGEVEFTPFPIKKHNHDSLSFSTLRDNIDVTFNGDKVYGVGSDFDKNDFETIANIKYPWGHVHIFASKERKDSIDTGSNVTVLSDGLYQFLDKIPVNWGETGWDAKSIQRDIYFDVVPSIRANEPGYPFSLDREGFTSKAKEDLEKMKQFIWAKYRLMELKDTSSEFGDFHYLIKKGNKVTTKQPNKLTTNKKEDTSNPLNVSANLESKNGKLVPNTNKVPTIDAKTLNDIDIDVDQFKVNQDQIDPNATLIHNNLLVRQDEYTLLYNERDRLQEKMDKDQEMLDQMPKYLPDTFDETPEHKALRESIDKQYEEIEKLSNKLWDTSKSTWKPIDVLGREKFGERFDRCMYDIGDIFRAIRDRVVILANKGDLPNGESYAPLQKYAVGISFDQEYLGVNVKLPFNGVYVNPIFSDFKDNYRTKAMGLFGTMLHELAHFQVSGHGAQFPKEMQRITAALEADEHFDINDLRQELIAIYKRNDDILTYLNTLGGNKNDTKPVGIRFQDEQYERRATSSIRDLAQTGAEGKARQIISKDVEQRDRDAQSMRQPQSVPSEIKTDESVSENQRPLNEQEAQTEQGSRQIFNYRGEPVDIRKWQIPSMSKIAEKLDHVFWAWADEHSTLDKVQKAIKALGRTISNMSDMARKMELRNSKITDQLEQFVLKEVNPIIKKMLDFNVSMDDIKQYLHARHAEEYNNRMNEINHKVDRNGNIVHYRLKDRASGMSTEDANNYLNSLDETRERQLKEIADMFYDIRDRTQEILVESGQETQETIDLWREIFPDYVPLNREQEQQAVPSGLRTGVGVDTRGDFSKRATGSEKAIINPIDALLYQRERAIARAENNEVSKAVYRLALENPNPDFWMAINPDAIYDREALIQELQDMGYANAEEIADNIMAEPKERYLRKVRPSDFVIDPTTGLPIPNTKEVVDQRISRNARFGDNVLALKINGRERFVFFNQKDPLAKRMVRSLKNLDAETLGPIVRFSRYVTHYFGQINTVIDPVFSLVNGLKDYPFAMANLSTTPLKGKQLEVSANIFPAMMGIISVLRKQHAGDTSVNEGWQQVYREAKEAGFQTANRYAILKTGEDKAYIEQTMNKFTDGNSKKAFRYVVDALYDFGSMVENGVRLASYKTARDMGMSPEEAASIAKNVTVNFDKKGARTGAIRSLYLFFNASVRSTVRLAETLNGPTGKYIIGGGILLGVMQAMLLASAGFKDDDPPEYIKEHNLVIPTSNGKYTTIPLAYGLNVLPNIGRIFTEYGQDVNKHGWQKAQAMKRAINLTNSFFSSFSPFGNQGLSPLSIIPSVAEPVVGLAINKNAFGQTISKQDSYTRPTPGYTRTKETGSSAGKEIARLMNLAMGGTDYAKSKIWSPTGDDIDFLIGSLTGGPGREISKISEFGKNQLTGKETPAYRVPVVGRFYGETDTKPVISSRFYNNINQMYEHENTLKNLAKDPVAKREYLQDNPDARLYKSAEQFEYQINELNAMKKKLQMAGRPQEQIDRIDNKKIILMNRFNDRVEKAKSQ